MNLALDNRSFFWETSFGKQAAINESYVRRKPSRLNRSGWFFLWE